MLLFQLLNALDPTVTPERTKLHLATFNQIEEPLDVYRRGVEQWERWQRASVNAISSGTSWSP